MDVSVGLSFYLVPIYWNRVFVIHLFFMVTKFMEQSPFEKLILFSASQFSRLFVEAESLLPCIKSSVSLHYPEPEEPLSRHLILLLHFNIIYYWVFQVASFPLGLTKQTSTCLEFSIRLYSFPLFSFCCLVSYTVFFADDLKRPLGSSFHQPRFGCRVAH